MPCETQKLIMMQRNVATIFMNNTLIVLTDLLIYWQSIGRLKCITL